MLITLSGKTAIVSASSEGIGFAIAKGLAESGARVAVNGRSQERVRKACAAIIDEIPKASLVEVVADLSTEAGADELYRLVPECDILVNNLSIYKTQDFFDLDDHEWRSFFEINVLSGVRLSRKYLPGMKNKGWGRVVFISSESAFNIPADMIHYGFTKTAMVSIARGLAKRMAGTGVTVNSVLPGPTLSEGMAAMFKEEAERTGRPIVDLARDFVRDKRPSSIIDRAATVEEVANMVVYTCSLQASATTGAALRVDGGVIDTL